MSPSLLMVHHPQPRLSSSKNWLSVSLNWSNWGPSVVQARATVGDGRWCELILMVSTLNIVFIFSPSATEGQSPRDDDFSSANQSPVSVPNWPMPGDHCSPLTGVSVTNVTWRLVSDWGRVSPGAGRERSRHQWSQHHVWGDQTWWHAQYHGSSSRSPGSGRHICIVRSCPGQQSQALNNRKVAVKNQSNSRQSDLGHQPEILSSDQLPNVKILKEKSIKQTRIGHFLSWLAH